MNSYVEKEYGRLTIVEDLGYCLREGSTRKRHWLKCVCVCGNECIVTLDSLKSGKTKSCGCYRKSRLGKERKKYNNYYIAGDVTYIQYSNCQEYFIIDTEDLDKIKDICWYKDKDGYAVNKSKNSFLMAHRVIMNTSEGLECDHINRNTCDNRKCNLRNVTHRENNLNKGMYAHNTSGYKGVHFDKSKQKWVAQITSNGRRIFLGYFDNPNEAYKNRLDAEINYFGKLAG